MQALTPGPVAPDAPAQFLETARRIADMLSLDVDKVADGYPITYRDADFWLSHNGSADPGGMVLMTEIGRLEPGKEAQVLRDLMEYHYIAPVALQGWCAVLPGTSLLVFCVRIDFDRTPNPAGAVLEFMENMVEQSAALVARLGPTPRSDRAAQAAPMFGTSAPAA